MIPLRTNVAAEINLLSSVRRDQFKVLVAPGGEMLEFAVLWPSYMTNTR